MFFSPIELIYEHWRGDLNQLRANAESYYANEPSHENLLIVASVDWLQVRLTDAENRFEAVYNDVTAAAHYRLYALTGSHLVKLSRFNLFPNLCGGNSFDLQQLWQPVADDQAYQAAWQTLSQQPMPPYWVWVCQFLHHIVRNVASVRSIVTGSRGVTSAEQHAQYVQMLLQPYLQFRDATARLPDLALMTAYIEWACADMLMRAGFAGDAASYLQQAFARYEQLGDHVGAANCYLLHGDYSASTVAPPTVWHHLIADGTYSNALSWVREREEFDYSPVNAAAAEEAWGHAAHHFTTAGSQRGLGMVAVRRSFLAMVAGDYTTASTLTVDATAQFAASGDVLAEQLARVLQLCCAVGMAPGSADFETATRIGRWGKEGGSFSYASGLGTLLAREGRRWLQQQGDFRRAIVCFRLAERLFIALGAVDSAAQTRFDIADARRSIGNEQSAHDDLVQVRDTFARLSDERPSDATAYWEKAVAVADELCKLGQSAQRADMVQQSVERLTALFNAPPHPPTDSMFGVAFTATLPNLVNMRQRFADVLVPVYRGLQAMRNGQPAVAERYFADAHTAAQAEAPHRNFLTASVLRAWRRDDEAADAYRRYLAEGGTTTDMAGQLANEMQDQFGTAAAPLVADRQTVNHQLAAQFFANCGYFGDALAHLQQIEAADGVDWWHNAATAWEMAALYARVQEGLGAYPVALGYYAQAIAILETRQRGLGRDADKLAFQGQYIVQNVYFYAARTAAKAWLEATSAERPTYAAQLVAFAANGRARALRDMLATHETQDAALQTIMAQIREQEAQLMLQQQLIAQAHQQPTVDAVQVAALRNKVAAGERALLALEQSLHAAAHDFVEDAPLTLAEIQQRLDAETVLLQFYFSDDDLLVWAISADAFAVHHDPNCDVKKLNRDVRSFHQQLTRRQAYADSAESLGKRLLEPLASILRDAKRLIIVPYDTLYQLPFCLLPLDGVPLIESHVVSYLPSPSLLRRGRSRPLTANDALVAVGNPAEMGRPLPAAELEAVSVAALFDAPVKLIGTEATEPAVRVALPLGKVLHLATHGRLSTDTPLQSSILLANGEELSVYELMGMNLSAQLAVLSACETGLGETTSGGELLGLIRGLLAAGVQEAVVTLWSVEDVATSVLMVEFYKRLLGGSAVAVALHEAQRFVRALSAEAISQLRAQMPNRYRHFQEDGSEGRTSAEASWQHPFYWAAFTLNGIS